MKFCVIGLGRFGYQVAIVLAEHGMEVLAIDSNETIVMAIRDLVTQAVCLRVTDEHSLRSVGVDEMDTVIVTMAENFAQSILITAVLKKKLNIKRVIARGISDIHKEILTLIGADKIVLPEKEIGTRLADSLSSPLEDQIRISKSFSISQMQVPPALINKPLKELSFLKNKRVLCIGIKKHDDIVIPELGYVIQAGDRLILAGSTKDLETIQQIIA